MKLKTRKMILIISMSAMGIGLIAFAVANNKGTTKQETAQVTAVNTPNPTTEVTPTVTENQGSTVQATPSVEPTATTTPTQTEDPLDSTIEMNAYPEINSVISDYLKATLSGDSKTLKTLVTDKKAIDIKKIQQRTEYIESYDNIEVYTKKGTGDIDFIAYVYLDMKISSIKTKAPGLNSYYIRKVGDSYKIVNEELNKKTQKYVEEVNDRKDVQDLIKSLTTKMNDAINNDETLKDFYSKIINNVDKTQDKDQKKDEKKESKKESDKNKDEKKAKSTKK